MKFVVAYIRPECLSMVKQELFSREIYAMSVTNILGAGRQKGYTEQYRGVSTQVSLLKKVRIEIGVPDAKLDDAMQAVVKGARTDHEGDGMIFVFDVAQALRIRTGEKY